MITALPVPTSMTSIHASPNLGRLVVAKNGDRLMIARIKLDFERLYIPSIRVRARAENTVTSIGMFMGSRGSNSKR